MNKKSLLSTIILLLCFNLFSQSLTIAPTINIRFYDKKVYTNNSEILIQIEFFNKNDEDLIINLADTRSYNFKFMVTTLDYKECEMSDTYLKLATYKKPYQYKQLTLKPREKFSFIEKLNDYVIIEGSGQYIVKVYFYNEFLDSGEIPIESNKLLLDINTLKEYNEKKTNQNIQTTNKLAKVVMEPDKVIKYMLDGRINNQWDKFLLYMDIEKIYIKDATREELYRKASEEERQGMLDNFKIMLENGETDKQLIMVPSKYEIIKTSYTDSKADVVAYEYFDYLTFIEKKEYKYKLEKFDGIWVVVDYNVRNLGVTK